MARKYLNIYNFENQNFAMKKLLLAPFLLASLFLFGGELKAYPNSRYGELNQNSRRNVNSLKLQNSNSKIYLLNYAAVIIAKNGKNRYITGSMHSPFVSYFQDSISCQRAILSLRILLKNFYSKEGSFKFKTFFNCTASPSNNSDVQIPEYYNFPFVFIENGVGKNKSRRPGFPINEPIPFKKLSTCNSYGRKLRNSIQGWDINSHTDDLDKWKLMYVCVASSNL